MSTEASRKVDATLIQDFVDFRPGGADGPNCNRCGCGLQLEQPNLSNPSRLLGVCQNCDTWEVIEVLEREESAWVTILPGECWPGEAPGGSPASR